ncbi:hypothetical protein DL96DRAFT_1589671 [Flagelloscypha sp. PMI_526]|nr:hypothetical protein DL96DRAFT_1589671 [Flagelloscypha sp. PMI_526]
MLWGTSFSLRFWSECLLARIHVVRSLHPSVCFTKFSCRCLGLLRLFLSPSNIFTRACAAGTLSRFHSIVTHVFLVFPASPLHRYHQPTKIEPITQSHPETHSGVWLSIQHQHPFGRFLSKVYLSSRCLYEKRTWFFETRHHQGWLSQSYDCHLNAVGVVSSSPQTCWTARNYGDRGSQRRNAYVKDRCVPATSSLILFHTGDYSKLVHLL